jgi:hypothetical protein
LHSAKTKRSNGRTRPISLRWPRGRLVKAVLTLGAGCSKDTTAKTIDEGKSSQGKSRFAAVSLCFIIRAAWLVRLSVC